MGKPKATSKVAPEAKVTAEPKPIARATRAPVKAEKGEESDLGGAENVNDVKEVDNDKQGAAEAAFPPQLPVFARVADAPSAPASS